MNTFAIRGRLLFGVAFEPGTLIVSEGRIEHIRRGHLPNGNLPDTVIDADLVTPGLIDLQVNGAIGHQVDHDTRHMEAISEWLASTGVTAWLPTVVTSPASAYPPLFTSWPLVDATVGATPLGYHLEGPFLSPARKGAHQLRYIEEATEDIFEIWLAADCIRLVTLASERDGNLEKIRKLRDRDILVSLGHTDATLDEFLSGVDNGARMATHLFNAMSPMHHRNPGAMIAIMTDDRVAAGLIPDGIHSHPATVRLALAAKGPDRIALVSDMMSAAGLGPGEYDLGGQTVHVSNDSARLSDGTLAGAVITMDDAVRNMSDWGGATTGEAFHMATAVPARLLNDRSRGRLAVDCRADLTLWSSSIQVEQTIVNGAIAWNG